MSKIAFLGLGAMGSRVATNLIKAGHSLTVWNRDPNKTTPLASLGAALAGTSKCAASGADIVLSMVRDDEASGRVWFDPRMGALAAIGREEIGIECSTLSVGCVKAAATAAVNRGIAFLDAPVAGSRPQAEAGQLIFLVGRDAEVLARAEPVLKAMGGSVHHAGPNGAGAAVKLAVNTLFGVQVAVLAELLSLTRANGVCPIKLAETIASTPVASAAAKAAAQSIFTRTFAPTFPVELADKDLAYATQFGEASNSPAPTTTAARSVMQRAIEAGYGADHITGVVRMYPPLS